MTIPLAAAMHERSLAVFLPPPPSPYLTELCLALAQNGITVMTLTKVEEIRRVVQTGAVDLILADGYSSAGTDILQASRRSSTVARPALALIREIAWDEPGADKIADLVLPPLPAPALLHLALTYLDLRTSLVRLEHARQALADENLRLKTERENQRRMDDEISLLKTAIVRNVSHELKTPLLQVKSAVALLAEDGSDVRTLVEYAVDATARLEAGIRNITLLNELLNDSIEFDTFSPVLVSEIMDYALRNLRRSWEHKNQMERIQVQLDADVPPVLGNKQGLGIVVQLLLDNALKFSQETVTVHAHRQGDRVEIAVEDRGIGIAPDKLEKIFDAFFQVDSSSTRRFGGMGIGLAIVRFVLDRHHTQIHVSSRVGQGSRFAFTLPASDIAHGTVVS